MEGGAEITIFFGKSFGGVGCGVYRKADVFSPRGEKHFCSRSEFFGKIVHLKEFDRISKCQRWVEVFSESALGQIAKTAEPDLRDSKC